MNGKAKISRLLYLRKQLETVIDNCITEQVLRDKDIDVDRLKDSLIYQIDDNIEFLKQDR